MHFHTSAAPVHPSGSLSLQAEALTAKVERVKVETDRKLADLE